MSTLAIGGRISATSPVVLAGFCFLIFAPIELVASFAVHNSAIAGNASHDAFDGLYFIVFGSIDTRMARSTRHEIYCRMRGYFKIVTALMAVLFVGVGLVIETNNDAGLDQMLAAVILGPISFTLNWYWEKRTHGHSGFNVHLLGDMAGSVIVTACGVLAFGFSDGRWNRYGGFLILFVTFVIAIRAMTKIGREINHPATLHPHDHPEHQH